MCIRDRSKGEDIGFVGNIKNVNPKVLYDLLDNDFLPVVCPVGMDDDFNTCLLYTSWTNY